MHQQTYFHHSRNIQSFDDGYEVRGVFLDISKTSDKVWHQGLHYKLRQNGVSSELLNTLTDFFNNRTQRVILNGQYSLWAKVEIGVLQGSILGSLLFLIHISMIYMKIQRQTLNYLLTTAHSSL